MDRAHHLPADAADPAERKARVALRAALALLVPLARWLVHNGVPYSSSRRAASTNTDFSAGAKLE